MCMGLVDTLVAGRISTAALAGLGLAAVAALLALVAGYF